jgi:hypothetical protein
MSTAGIYNFTLDQGSVFYINLQYKNPDNTPIDLTGQTARMQLRRTFTSPAEITLTSPSGGIVITPLTGLVAITITDEQTETLGSGFYVYDLELDNAGVINRIIQGQITVSPQVTANV